MHAGNRLAAIEALDAGVTTCVDWSHGLQTTEHAEAAVDALRSVPGRFVLAYGNIQQGPWEWATSADFRAFVARMLAASGGTLGFQMAFDVTGDPAFPEKAAFEAARELGVPVTTHAGVWGATNDDGIRLMHEHGFMNPHIYVHAATLSRGLLPPDRRHRRVGLGLRGERAERRPGLPAHVGDARYGIPVSLSMDTSVWFSGDLFSAMRTTLSADRAREHMAAHTPGGDDHQRQPASRDVVDVGHQRRGQDARPGRSLIGSTRARRPTSCWSRTRLTVSFPLLNPYGHVALQAGAATCTRSSSTAGWSSTRHRLVGIDLAPVRQEIEATVGYLRSALGEEAWVKGMHPDVPGDEDPGQPVHLHRVPHRQHPRPLNRRGPEAMADGMDEAADTDGARGGG